MQKILLTVYAVKWLCVSNPHVSPSSFDVLLKWSIHSLLSLLLDSCLLDLKWS